MEVFSVWPFFACMAVLWTLAATPLFRSADAPPSDKGFRVTTIDGLRGFLALSVVFHHGAVYDGFLREDLWAVPPSRFYAMIGQVGVAICFMITGYVFWGRMVETQGRPGWVKFYIGRLFRIGPLYLLAIAVMLSIVFAHTGPHLNVPPMTLAVQVGRWLLLGLFESWNVNGYPHAGHALAGVTWTLRYEWLFYASLLLTAFAARSDRTHLPFALVGLALTLTITAMHPSADPSCAALFFAGMTCASLEQV